MEEQVLAIMVDIRASRSCEAVVACLEKWSGCSSVWTRNRAGGRIADGVTIGGEAGAGEEQDPGVADVRERRRFYDALVRCAVVVEDLGMGAQECYAVFGYCLDPDGCGNYWSN